MKPIPVLFLTYNRLDYTKQTLKALLETKHPVEIYIHDNYSTDGTIEWLKNDFQKYCLDNNYEDSIGEIVYSDKNIGLNKPFNNFIRKHKNEKFIAKVDNDTLIEPNWLTQLLYVLRVKPEIDAVSAYLQRPPGPAGSFEEWKNSTFMRRVSFGENELAYCSYCAGSGVLIRMKMFQEMGLLWEGYKSVQGDLTCMFRLRSKHGKLDNIAWYSGTTGKLLNIKIDGKELSDDYPEYDKEIQAYRDAGNKWFTEQGGADGIASLIEKSGGREKL